MFGRKKIAMIVAELLGVGVLSMVMYAMLARTSFPLFSGLAGGLTLGVLVLSIGPITGAHLNPAVTISMWVMRKIDTPHAVVYIAAQMVGGAAAWGMIRYFLGHSLTSIAGAHFTWRVAVAEGVGAAVFTYGAAAAMIQKLDPAKSAFVIGGSFFLGVLVASLASNGIINPAVALGIQSWDWAYAVGPIAGAVVGSNIYGLMYAASTAPSTTRSKKSRR